MHPLNSRKTFKEDALQKRGNSVTGEESGTLSERVCERQEKCACSNKQCVKNIRMSYSQNAVYEPAGASLPQSSPQRESHHLE